MDEFQDKLEEAMKQDGQELIEEHEVVDPRFVNEGLEEVDEVGKVIRIRHGDQVWEIPEDAELDVTTRAGQEAAARLAELKNDFWGKAEISRRINEAHESAPKLSDEQKDLLEAIVMESDDLRGFDRVYTILEDMYRVNPKLGPDIKDFAEKLRGISDLDPEQAERLRLKQENMRLKNKNRKDAAGKSAVEIEQRAAQTANFLSQKLGLDPQEFAQKAQELIGSGQMGDLSNIQSADDVDLVLAQVGSKLSEDKIVEALSSLSLKQEEQETAILKAWGLLQSDLSMSEQELARQVSAVLGKSTQSTTNARGRVEQRRAESGFRPEKLAPKPAKDNVIEPYEDFNFRIQKRLGI